MDHVARLKWTRTAIGAVAGALVVVAVALVIDVIDERGEPAPAIVAVPAMLLWFVISIPNFVAGFTGKGAIVFLGFFWGSVGAVTGRFAARGPKHSRGR